MIQLSRPRRHGFIGHEQEIELLDAWLDDLSSLVG